jgi:hypothetical protein
MLLISLDRCPGRETDSERGGGNLMIGKVAGFLFWIFAMLVILATPAHIVLIRVQASLFPEGEEAIIPFDRTFKGRFIAEREGGDGVLGIRDAWVTFGWADWRRLFKLWIKIFGIHVAVAFVGLFVVIVLLSLLVILKGSF